MMMIDDIPEPKEAQLNCNKAFESLDWSIIRLLLAWRCCVFWAAAGRGLEPPPPMMKQLRVHWSPKVNKVQVNHISPQH